MRFTLHLDQPIFFHFSHLLQKGFVVEAEEGSSIKDLLCRQFSVEEDYLENRIKTIFLDGKPVDDVDKAIVKDGSTLALSAAMPGLVGSTFRRGGVLASFRSGITYQPEDANTSGVEGVKVTIKLFNMVVSELGPLFLQEGMLIQKDSLRDLLDSWHDSLPPHIKWIEKDDKQIPSIQLAALDWSQATENVFLRAVVSTDRN
jgi:hypothetical protein